jgi:bifunctional UDP-N-acetylglucosamine pyrophosphorylase / glucosamine-1-phosphate N-acetyltransferase
MKVLHPIGGRSMIGHVLAAVQAVEPRNIVAVVGHQREQVGPHIQALVPGVVLAVQETQEGTGHAVRVAVEAAGTTEGTVIVAAGDTPLLDGDSLRAFAADHEAAQRAVSILSGVVPNPTGYGRVLRNDEGDVEAIVEEKDATREQREIREINSGILAFDAEFLLNALPRISNDNAKGEYYLTDAIGIAREDGLTVGAFAIDDVMQTEGANDRAQLAELGRELNRRIVDRWMREGVTVMDPATTWIDADVELEADAVIHPFTVLRGKSRVAAGAEVGPHVVGIDAEIGPGATVGPFCYLRPGTVLEAGAKAGTFVEIKNSHIGEGAKVPHLSYIGDAEVGAGTNIGAGAITANYRPELGGGKQRTTIGRNVHTGSQNVFVAPVTLGDNAWVAAGSVVTKNVPPGALALGRARQVNKEGYDDRKRHD